MNRSERRRQEREFKKNLQTINNLTPQQTKIIDIAARERAERVANERMEEFAQIIDRNMSAVLIEYGFEIEEIEKLQDRMSELLLEDTEKSQKLEKEKVDIMKIQEEVRQAIEGLLEKRVGKKEAIEELVFKFPKLSKSMLLNAYSKVRKEKEEECKITREKIIESAKKHGLDTEGKKKIAEELGATLSTIVTYISRWKITEEEIADAKKTDAAVEEIMDIIENKPKEEKEEDKDLKETAEKIIETAKEMQCKEVKKDVKVEGLKILEEKVVKTIKVEGKNGTYEAETGKGVILSRENASISFDNEEQLDNWVSEFKAVFKMVM